MIVAVIAYEVFAVGVIALIGWLAYRRNVADLEAAARLPFDVPVTPPMPARPADEPEDRLTELAAVATDPAAAE